MKRYRVLSFLLAIAILCTSFTACAKKKKPVVADVTPTATEFSDVTPYVTEEPTPTAVPGETTDPSETAETPDETAMPVETAEIPTETEIVPAENSASPIVSENPLATVDPKTSGVPAKTAANVTPKATAIVTSKATAKVTTAPTSKVTPKVTSNPTTAPSGVKTIVARDYIRIGGSFDVISPGSGTDNYTFTMEGDYTGKKLGLWGWFATNEGKIEKFGVSVDGGTIDYGSGNKGTVTPAIKSAASGVGSPAYVEYFDINPVIKDNKTHTYEVFAKIGTKDVHVWKVTAKQYTAPVTPKPTAKPGGSTTYSDNYVNDTSANNQQNQGTFTISYKTTSYVFIGQTIKLNATYAKSAGGSLTVSFNSKNTDIATVDGSGNVKGVKMGLATIRASVSNGDFIDFYVTVVPKDLTYPLYIALYANNANSFVRKGLSIDSKYYRDIYGSISKILYNDELSINTSLKAKTDAKLATGVGGGPLGGFKMEYVTVHYTGNPGVGAKGYNNAEYFSNCPSDLTVHFVTGNDGVFQVASPELYHVNSTGDRALGKPLTWVKTGVAAPTSGDLKPSIHISSDGYYTINGKKSTYKVPSRSSASSFIQGGCATCDSIKITGDTFVYQGSTYPVITNLGIPWKVEDGEYKLALTYWNGTQQWGGRIASFGGDYNSIAIESAVNEDSELWYTWNKTAQLVAKLLVQFNLDTTRIAGHNTWTAKLCPAPMIQNNNEIWDIFVDMCKWEYEKIVSGGKYSMTILKGSEVVSQTTKNRSLASTNGTYTVKQGAGVVVPDNKAHVVLYEVTVVRNGKTEKIKLACAVNKK